MEVSTIGEAEKALVSISTVAEMMPQTEGFKRRMQRKKELVSSSHRCVYIRVHISRHPGLQFTELFLSHM